MSVVLPTKNADRFENLFIGKNEDNKEKKQYFARCFLVNSERESNANGLTRLCIQYNAAWSIYNCMINGYPQKSNGKCPTLEEACKELKVVRLIARSREPFIGFEEIVNYTFDEDLTFESRDLFPEPFADCLDNDERLPEELEM